MDERDKQEIAKEELRRENILTDIIAFEGIPAMISCSAILGLFRPSNYQAALSIEDMANGVSSGKWFKSPAEDNSLLIEAVGMLEKYKLLFKYPDGKYVYRDFE